MIILPSKEYNNPTNEKITTYQFLSNVGCPVFDSVLFDENELYLEIYFETSDYSCICKVTATSPVETAVDFKVTTYNLFGFGKGKKVIEELYKLLDKKLTFKGVGLFKGM